MRNYINNVRYDVVIENNKKKIIIPLMLFKTSKQCHLEREREREREI